MDNNEGTMRLQKYLAHAGIASRRKAEALIKTGRVCVNGKIVKRMGMLVGECDSVTVDGSEVESMEKKVYIMLNKPVGYISTAKDQFSRKTVLDLVEGIKQRIYPVGRLDYNTSGLLILTNDGELAQRITHPGNRVKKVYEAVVEGIPSDNDIKRFKKGVDIGGYVTASANMKILSVKSKNPVVEIVIHEGKNRQVRKMCSEIGHPVIKLKRTAEGELKLGSLKEGKWRHLKDFEVKKLYRGV